MSWSGAGIPLVKVRCDWSSYLSASVCSLSLTYVLLVEGKLELRLVLWMTVGYAALKQMTMALLFLHGARSRVGAFFS